LLVHSHLVDASDKPSIFIAHDSRGSNILTILPHLFVVHRRVRHQRFNLDRFTLPERDTRIQVDFVTGRSCMSAPVLPLSRRAMEHRSEIPGYLP